MAVCPKCGFELAENQGECPRCGVILAKARPGRTGISHSPGHLATQSRPAAKAQPSADRGHATIDELNNLAEQIRRKVQQQVGRRPPDPVLFVSLAQYFDYNVTKGGFAQLIYNLQGKYLEEIEKMLLSAPAPVAYAHYMQALRECLANMEAYQTFLGSDFVAPSALKDSLHRVTLSYYDGGQRFIDEIDGFLSRVSGDVQAWLHTSG